MRFESSLIDVSLADLVVVFLPLGHVGDGQTLREGPKILVALGPQHKMPTVGHYLIPQNSQGTPFQRLGNHPLEYQVVIIVEE